MKPCMTFQSWHRFCDISELQTLPISTNLLPMVDSYMDKVRTKTYQWCNVCLKRDALHLKVVFFLN